MAEISSIKHKASPPSLSVTITNYNYEQFIGRAIQSVLDQTFTDFEIIIADNASTDGSMAVIEKFQKQDPRIKVIANAENRGLVNNFIIAADAATGRYCVHLDADDWILSRDAFAKQIAVLEADPDISFVWSPVVLADPEGSLAVIRFYENDQAYSGFQAIEDALKIHIMHSGLLFRMSTFKAFGGYDTNFYYSVDIRLASELCLHGKVGYINEPLYARYEHGGNTSSTSRLREQIVERVRAIDCVCDGPRAAEIPDIARIRKEAMSSALFNDATQQAFRNHYREALKSLSIAIQVRPKVALMNRQIVQLLLRMAVGQNCFSRIQTRFRSPQ